MTKKHSFNRRQFIGAAALATGGLLLPKSNAFGSFRIASPDEYPSTPHFWYFKPPNRPYVDSQNKNMAFAFTDTEIMLSDDNSHTWRYKRTFPDAKNITYSHIFNDGTALFATKDKLFLCAKELKSYKEIIVKDVDGKDYLPHTPQNPDNPGWYFHNLIGIDSWIVNGKEMLVWGNYCNVEGGGTPVNIYYSTDNGETVKIAYSFGQNPYYTDNGSTGAGKGGTLLGNPDNPIKCRHVHSVAYNPVEDAFYACTGDGNKPEGWECHWLRGTYDSAKDKWDWKVILTESWNSRYKAGSLTFVDGRLYWASDANGEAPYDRGIFSCDPADIGNKEAHTMLYDAKYETGIMIIEDGVILATQYAVASPFTLGILYSPDLGKTWFEYDIKDYGPYSPSRIHKKNGEGFFRMDLRTHWIDLADYMFVKPK